MLRLSYEEAMAHAKAKDYEESINLPKAARLMGDTALHRATYVETVSRLMKEGADPNANNVIGLTPLHIAAKRGHTDVAIELLKVGAEPNAKDEYGYTALHLILDTNYICDKAEMIETLISNSKEAVVNERNNIGLTPLHFACSSNLKDFRPNEPDKIIRLLIEKGADGTINDMYGASPLDYYMFKISQQGRIDLQGSTDRLRTRLEFETLQALLRAGCSVRQRSMVNGRTPFHVDAQNVGMSDECLQLLNLEDWNELDGLRNTLFHYGLHRSDVQETARPNAFGMTPSLMAMEFYAIKPGHRFPSPTTDVDRFQRTMLHIYSRSRWSAGSTSGLLLNLCVLISFDPDWRQMMDSLDFLNRTPLHHLIILGDTDYVSANYLEHTSVFECIRPYINIQDKFGRTVLHYAVFKHHVHIVDFLLKVGADPDIADKDGILPGDVLLAFNCPHSELPVHENGCKVTRICYASEGWVKQDTALEDRIKPFVDALCEMKPNDLWSAVESVANNCDLHTLMADRVEQFVKRIMSKVASIDDRFQSEQRLVGSCYEGTRAIPNEFDFLVVLSTFADSLLTTEHEDFPGFVSFKHKSTTSSLLEFCNADGVLQPMMVKDKLYRLLIEATSYPDVWVDGSFDYVRFEVTMGSRPRSPAITLCVDVNRVWNGKTLYIFDDPVTIDFVPVIPTDMTLPDDTPLSRYVNTNCRPVDRTLLATMKFPRYSFGATTHSLCAISSPIVESEVLRSSPASVKRSYMMLKRFVLLVTRNLSQYVVKLCVLDCIVNRMFDGVRNVDVVTAETMACCIRVILRRLCNYIVNDAVPCAANPERSQSVWNVSPSPGFMNLYAQLYPCSYHFRFNDDEQRDVRLEPSSSGSTSRDMERDYKWARFNGLESVLEVVRLIRFLCKRFGMPTTDADAELRYDVALPHQTNNGMASLRDVAMVIDSRGNEEYSGHSQFYKMHASDVER